MVARVIWDGSALAGVLRVVRIFCVAEEAPECRHRRGGGLPTETWAEEEHDSCQRSSFPHPPAAWLPLHVSELVADSWRCVRGYHTGVFSSGSMVSVMLQVSKLLPQRAQGNMQNHAAHRTHMIKLTTNNFTSISLSFFLSPVLARLCWLRKVFPFFIFFFLDFVLLLPPLGASPLASPPGCINT